MATDANGRSYDWCFTIDNVDEQFSAAAIETMFQHAVYGTTAIKEDCFGSQYLQGFVHFKNQKSLCRMRKFLANASFTRRSEQITCSEAIQLCKQGSISCQDYGQRPTLYQRRKPRTSASDTTTPSTEVVATVAATSHNNTCVVANAVPIVATDRDLVMMLIRESSDLKNLMIEQQSKMMEQQQNLVLEIVRSNNGVLTTSTNANALTAFSNNSAAVAIANAAANTNSANADHHQNAVVAAPHQTNTLNNTQNNLTNTNNSHNSVNNQNSHNKTFNLNFFLNETCKNAMNMSEFVESINLELADLMRVGEMGYVDGISDIILKNLRALEITERPIHCTDKKRETFYVKDDNQWQKETPENQKIKHAINRVANKNYRLLDEYKRSHPDCHRSHSIYCDQYNKIIVEATGGNLDIPPEEKARKIIHKISKEVGIRETDNSLSC